MGQVRISRTWQWPLLSSKTLKFSILMTVGKSDNSLSAKARFVVLYHTTPPGYARASHWDLMLEQGSVLWTWALENEPLEGKQIVANRLADHRLHYLDYEGPLDGDRGEVHRVDSGGYEIEVAGEDCLEVRLIGTKLRGRVRLVRDGQDNQRWWFSFVSDSARA